MGILDNDSRHNCVARWRISYCIKENQLFLRDVYGKHIKECPLCARKLLGVVAEKDYTEDKLILTTRCRGHELDDIVDKSLISFIDNKSVGVLINKDKIRIRREDLVVYLLNLYVDKTEKKLISKGKVFLEKIDLDLEKNPILKDEFFMDLILPKGLDENISIEYLKSNEKLPFGFMVHEFDNTVCLVEDNENLILFLDYANTRKNIVSEDGTRTTVSFSKYGNSENHKALCEHLRNIAQNK